MDRGINARLLICLMLPGWVCGGPGTDAVQSDASRKLNISRCKL